MKYINITSLSNPRIKQAVKIRNNKKKQEDRLFLIEGANLIEMALNAGSSIEEVFLADSFLAGKNTRNLIAKISKSTNKIYKVAEHILGKLAATETPRGIIAVASCRPKQLGDVKFKNIPLLVVVDGIRDPGNLGTIIRTSDAAGADAVVILEGSCDAFSQKTLRATAGSIFNLPVINTDADNLLKWLDANQISLVLTSQKAETSIFDADINKACAFVFGNEAQGISSELRKKTGMVLKIPILGKAESLNVTACAAVCLYEAVRQRELKVNPPYAD